MIQDLSLVQWNWIIDALRRESSQLYQQGYKEIAEKERELAESIENEVRSQPNPQIASSKKE